MILLKVIAVETVVMQEDECFQESTQLFHTGLAARLTSPFTGISQSGHKTPELDQIRAQRRIIRRLSEI